MMKFLSTIILISVLSIGNITAQNISEEQTNQYYETIKIELLCKTVGFIITENKTGDANALRCQDLASLENSLPTTSKQASGIFKVFKNKNHSTFGKGKLEARTDKFLRDLNAELSKLNRDRAWQENVQILQTQLAEIKKQTLEQLLKVSYEKSNPTAQADSLAEKIAQQNNIKDNKSSESPPNSNPKEQSSTMFSYLFVFFALLMFVATGGGFYFLYWQIKQLQEQASHQEEQLLDQIAHLESQLPSFTLVRDFQTINPKINILNDQLNVAVQEIMILKSRNENKPTMEELYAKRTEHLETLRYNPNLRVHYVKYRPDINGFNPQEFRPEPTRDSLYKLEINLENPNQAIFGIVGRSEYHNVALANADLMLAPACEYANPPYNDSRIITHVHGVAEKRGEAWVILKKAEIIFE